jgi:CheY-like chemotaxis protein
MRQDSVIRLQKILVIDDSSVLRDVMTAVLSPHCGEIITAEDCASARRQVADHSDISLILCDVMLPDGSGLDLLREFATRSPARIDVILMTARPVRADAAVARSHGALGYLAKPISFHNIVNVLLKAEGKRTAAPRLRASPLGQAVLIDSEGAPRSEGVWKSFGIRDMSASGAFLETPGPLEVGTMLDLCIDFGGSRARVLARTVRLQEPDWGAPGGVGVAFREFESGSREILTIRLEEILLGRS